MESRSRLVLSTLLLLIGTACADAPTLPTSDPGRSGPSRTGAYIPGEPGECDPWQDANWCQDPGGPGDGECITSSPGTGNPQASAGVQGCTPGGPGGGPGGGEEPPPSDTCRTGDPAFDSPDVKQGLNDLWTRSNPEAPQAQRLEQGAWIIQRPDGSYGMTPFSVSTQSPCGINGNFNAPQGAVGWVHTHPFTAGEVQTICGALKQPDPATGGWRDVIGTNGQPVYPVYSNRPSIPDRELMSDLNAVMGRLGRNPLAGVIIDANQTTVYSENPGDGTTTFPRCGY